MLPQSAQKDFPYTVVVLGSGKESVVLTPIAKNNQNCLAIRIPGKTSGAMLSVKNTATVGHVFKTITVDNGSEFADFAEVEQWSAEAYFAHPCTS